MMNWENKKRIFVGVIATAVFLFVGYFAIQGYKILSASAAGEQWLSGWSYRKVVTITNTNAVSGDSSCVSAGGVTCTQTIDGAYIVNKYTYNTGSGPATWTVPSGVTSVQYLIVGGGGAGGGGYGFSGGGGAGGFLAGTNFAVTSEAQLTVTVGAGGTPSLTAVGNGANSVFSSLTAVGGGGGGVGNGAGIAGGNGGSGGGEASNYMGYGTGSQGSSGGVGSSSAGNRSGGGGGGYGGAGYNGAANIGGNGGIGTSSMITGATTYYAAGGGGGFQASGTAGQGGSVSGTKIGGDGASSISVPGGNAVANTGSGGGGSSGDGANQLGGSGGSGIVIIRYPASISSLTDYQVKVPVTYSANMKADFSDLRFTSSDGSTALNYWIESYTASTSAVVWVKVPSVPSGASTIYMYYGNSGASTTSSGDNTFTFFDDFSGATLNSTKWTNSAPSISISGGIATVTNNANNDYVGLTSVATFGTGYAIRGRTNQYANSVCYDSIGFQTPTNFIKMSHNSGGITFYAYNGTMTNTGIGSFPNQYNIYDIYRNATSIAGLVNGGSTTTITTNLPTINLPVGVYPYGSTSAYIDWILVRKYVAVEPTVSVGAEDVPHLSFSILKDDACTCSSASECYSGLCTGGVCGAGKPSATSLSLLATASSFSCSVTTTAGCVGTPVLKLYSAGGSHASLPTYSLYTNSVCCSGADGLGTNCSGTYTTFLRLSAADGGHVQSALTHLTTYANNACISASAQPTCTYNSGSCPAGTTCLASISNDDNAHAADCTVYDTKVCCSIPAEDNPTYCQYYYDSSNVLQTGKDGQLQMQFAYTEPDSTATMSAYEVAIGTVNDVAQKTVDTGWITASAARNATITYTGTTVKNSPSTAAYQIGYGDGTNPQQYYWWVKIKNSKNVISDWSASSTFTTPKKHFPIVRAVADKTTAAAGANVQYCVGTDLSNQSVPASRDACYSVCWTGTPGSAVVDPTNSSWKCSVCYNTSGQPVSCSTNPGTTFTWKPPADATLVTGNANSALPVYKFSTVGTTPKMGLIISGSSCAAEGSVQVNNSAPTWKEVSPF